MNGSKISFDLEKPNINKNVIEYYERVKLRKCLKAHENNGMSCKNGFIYC